MSKDSASIRIRPSVREGGEKAAISHELNRIELYSNIVSWFLMQDETMRKQILVRGESYTRLFEAGLPFKLNEGFTDFSLKVERIGDEQKSTENPIHNKYTYPNAENI